MDLGLTLRQIGYRVKQFGLERLIKEQRGQGPGGKLKSLEPPVSVSPSKYFRFRDLGLAPPTKR